MAMSFGVLSTFPPTQCGIATFAQALTTHLEGVGAEVGIVRVVDTPQPPEPSVVHQLVIGAPSSAAAAAHVLSSYDVAIVQHEYGIFGGADGEDVLDVVDRLDVPFIAVLHTVLTRPTRHQHEVLDRLVHAASAIVTMTETARQRLISGWVVHPSRVTVIAHGAEDNRTEAYERPSYDPPTILTWGLLGQGKGIEWALQAMAELHDLDPRPVYRIVGQTHPRVLERDGEAYRESLLGLTDDLGLRDSVRFDGHYLAGPALRRIVREADIVLLPYDSREQVTSGVLTEAVAAGKPVVSTTFPHAVELLSGGAGLLVPQRDPVALAAALRRVLTEPGLSSAMGATARGLAPSLLWPAVARQYVSLGRSLRGAGKLSVA